MLLTMSEDLVKATGCVNELDREKEKLGFTVKAVASKSCKSEKC